MERLVMVSTSYYTAGVVIDIKGKVIDAAPIVKWMIGKDIVQLWNENKNKIKFCS